MNALELKIKLNSYTDDELVKKTICVVKETDYEEDTMATTQINLDINDSELIINI